MKRNTAILSALIGATALATAGDAVARDRIQIVGSSTVFPYTQAVAEEFAKKTGKQAPVVESTGTGGGMKIFCQGIGEKFPDLTGASRAMKKSEWEDCNKNGVSEITEILIGYDGLSIAVSRKGQQLDLSKSDLYLALAAEVPVDGKIVANPHKTWKQVNAKLADVKIQVYGPPPTSGTRDAFVELALHPGCEALEFFKAKKKELEADKKAYETLVKEKCSPMRQDGPFIESGENDNLIVQRLEKEPTAYGIFGYSFLFENQDKLMASKVDAVEPNFDTIAKGSYGIARPLYVYIKNAHRKVIPGLNEFVSEYVSDRAMGKDGYLSERGLVILSDAKRKEMQDKGVKGAGMGPVTTN